MSIRHQIIDYCLSNRVSTTEVSDALGKSGLFEGVYPLNHTSYIAGQVRCIFASHNSNWHVHEQIRDVNPGDVVVIFAEACDKRAIIGELVCKYLLLYRRASAVVVQGFVRDIAALKREGYNIWSLGHSPIGCFNQPSSIFNSKLKAQLLRKYEGGIAICDAGGVVLIDSKLVTLQTLKRIEFLELQEDIWFYCLDVLKWDTKRIVCDKEYLSDLSILPKHLLSRYNELVHYWES